MRSRATAFGAPTSKVAPSRPINPAGRNQVSRSARLTSPRRASSARVAAQTCRLESPTSSIVKSGASARSGVRSSRGAGRMGTPRGGSGRGGPGSRGWGKAVPLPAQQDLSDAARRHERAPRLDRVPDGGLQPAPAGARDIFPLQMRRRGHQFEAGGEIAQQLAFGRGGGAVVGALEGAQRGGLARPIRRWPRSRTASSPELSRSQGATSWRRFIVSESGLSFSPSTVSSFVVVEDW